MLIPATACCKQRLPDVACLQAGAVRVNVKGQDAPRVDPDDFWRQVTVLMGLAGT
jgi:hypothetical protein